MLVDAETARKLREIGAGDLVEALRAQDDDMCAMPTFSERIHMAADEAHSSFISQKGDAARTHGAALRFVLDRLLHAVAGSRPRTPGTRR